MDLRTVELKDLRFGHELPKGGINDRVSGRDSLIDELAANIGAVGLLQPPIAWANGSKGGLAPFYVLAGNRRLAAMRKLNKTGCDVLMVEAMDLNEALNLAASSNLHVPIHPIDRFETFARLQTGGMVPKAISQTYGLELKEVERSLALGALAPEIRAAWRDGKLSADIARVFTLEPDQKRQADIYAKLKKARAHSVRLAILGDTSRLGAMLKFVTPGAYKAAGGRIRVDLFAEGDDTVPQDAALLNKLAVEKLDVEVARLKKAGWKWVMRAGEIPPHQWWEERGPKADKKKTGATVDVSHDGKLHVRLGVVKPADAKAMAAGKEPAAAKPKKAKADPKVLSGALAGRLDTQVALAVQDILTAWAQQGHPLTRLLASETAGMIAPERMSWSTIKIDDVRNLRDAAPIVDMRNALLKRFDAKDYFASIPTQLLRNLLEIGELNEAKMQTFPKVGKTQLVDIAVKRAAGIGWLPIQVRQAAPKATKARKHK